MEDKQARFKRLNQQLADAAQTHWKDLALAAGYLSPPQVAERLKELRDSLDRMMQDNSELTVQLEAVKAEQERVVAEVFGEIENIAYLTHAGYMLYKQDYQALKARMEK